LREMVELVAPGAVDAGDGLARVPLAAAHQRLRDALPHVGPHLAAGAAGAPAPRRRDGPAPARARPAHGRGGARSALMPAEAGVIRGGWEFVWAAYGVSAVILTGYAVSVIVRYRAQRRRRGEVRP